MQFPNGRYWWMSTNPDTFKTWSLFDMKEGRANGCYWLMKNDQGHYRGTPEAFRAIRKGDYILGYVGGYSHPRGVHSLLQCTRALSEKPYEGEDVGAHICVKKVRDLDQYIPWEVFANAPALKNARMVKLHNSGCLFGFTEKEQAALLKLVRGFRGQRAEPQRPVHVAGTRKTNKRAVRAPAEASPRELAARLTAITRTVKLRKTAQRAGQRELRDYLLNKSGKCAVTGLKFQPLLVVSHIKDWTKCTRDERLDPHNVLLLSANYDAVFDQKLISFDASGRIVKSDAITWQQLAALGVKRNAKIPRPHKLQAKYLSWHRARLRRH